MPVAAAKFPPNAFLSDVRCYDIGPDGIHGTDGILGTSESPLDSLAVQAVASGNPELVIEPTNSSRPFRAAIAIPIHRDGSVVSVVVLAAASGDKSTGVFEIWSPIGEYYELSLSKGYFGPLNRFENVSSFVRFEKGSGLPGQVWDKLAPVIQDELADHRGFLRAAGASADALGTAIGIPVVASEYIATVLLISSPTTPIARGFEVWNVEADGFKLEFAAYASDDIRLELGTKLSVTSGLLGRVLGSGVAMLSDDESMLLAGRGVRTGSGAINSGVAIPFYQADAITSITVLLI